MVIVYSIITLKYTQYEKKDGAGVSDSLSAIEFSSFKLLIFYEI